MKGYVETTDVQDELCRSQGYVARADLDAVYRERNRLVAALTRLAPRLEWEVAMTPDDDEPGWFIVYLVTEAGQMSWHVSDEEAVDLFAHVPDDLDISWDGHDTSEKYRRLARIGVSHG